MATTRIASARAHVVKMRAPKHDSGCARGRARIEGHSPASLAEYSAQTWSSLDAFCAVRTIVGSSALPVLQTMG